MEIGIAVDDVVAAFALDEVAAVTLTLIDSGVIVVGVKRLRIVVGQESKRGRGVIGPNCCS